MSRFKNKIVVVTGASRGIGEAIAVAFASEGAKVIGVARSDQSEPAAKAKAAGGEYVAIKADLSQGTQKEAADLINQIVSAHGKIDVLVNNAGVIRRAPATDFPEAEWN